MSDGIIQETAPSAPVLVAEPSPPLDLLAPLVLEPVAAPVVIEQPDVPAPTLAPVEAPAFEHHSEVPSLLGDQPEPVAPVERPAAETVEATAPAAIPDAYEFKVPDDIRMTDADRGTVTETFRKLGFDQAKADIALDAYYTKARQLKAGLEETEGRRHQDAFMAMRRGWVDQIKGTNRTITVDGQEVPDPTNIPPHPVLGQPGALKSVQLMRDRLVPASDKDGWKEMCGLTGAGDHPALALMVYRAHEEREKMIAEYEAKIVAEVAKALEPYQEGRAPTLRGKPVDNPNRDPDLTGFQALYDRNSAAR